MGESLLRRITNYVVKNPFKMGTLTGIIIIGGLGLISGYESSRSRRITPAMALVHNQNYQELPDRIKFQNNIYSFACNYWNYNNNDCKAGFPDGFAGIKKIFTNKESVVYVILPVSMKKGEESKNITKNNNGEIIRTKIFTEDTGGTYILWAKFSPGELPIGINRTSFYLNNKYIGFVDAEIAKVKEPKKQEDSKK